MAVDQAVVLTQASCGYLDFAENWILHVEDLGIKNYLTIVDDEGSFEYLNARFPGHIVTPALFGRNKLKRNRPIMEYGSAGFDEMMCERLTFQQKVLDHGFTFLWSDMDTVWYQNPLDIMPKGFDFVGVDDSYHGPKHLEQNTGNLCGCFMFWRPTQRSKDFLKDWYSNCAHQAGDDQQALNRMWTSGDMKQKLHWYIMPRQLFPSGTPALSNLKIDWSPNEDPARPHTLFPAWIHANCRIGHEAKRGFLKERLAWNITDDSKYPTC